MYVCVRLDPRKNWPAIIQNFPHTIQIAQHRLWPCRVVKITNDAVPSIGDVFKCIISAIASKETGTIHLLTPVPQGSVSTNKLPSMRVEGKKTPCDGDMMCHKPRWDLCGVLPCMYSDDQTLERFLSGCSGFSHRWSCARVMLRQGADVVILRLGCA